tara:strand:+ start:2751 stop:3179 length:429 start_codon:yes stop_codon:yes gene_type:complete
MPKAITLVPTWEAAAQIHLMALQNPVCPQSTKNGAEDEIMALACAYDALIADVNEEQANTDDSHSTGPANEKPFATIKDVKLYVLNTIVRAHGEIVSHDNPRHLILGERAYTSQIVTIGLVDTCLVIETLNTNYVVEGTIRL